MIKILLIFFFTCNYLFAISIDNMIGQMLLVGVGGSKVSDKWVKVLRDDIKNGRVGGVVFFKNNVHSKKELKKLTGFLNPKELKLKPFIAINQEGGEFSNLFANYPSAYEVANKLDLNEASKMYEGLVSELKEYGFNLNFAPVVDLNKNPNSSKIGAKNRSYSAYEEIVISYASEFIKALDEKNIISVIKHFPGYGSSSSDTWDYNELKPYYYFIKYNKVDAIMVGHIYLSQFDKIYPATLSNIIIQGILRDKMKFNGVVFSDDMQKKELLKKYTLKESVIRAINAGVNVLVFSSYFTKKSSVINDVSKIIKEAVKNGEIKKENIIDSYNRIVKLKERL